jgi:hypothetical protein
MGDLMDVFCNPVLWTSLHHAEMSSIADLENFGWNQPAVRKSAWATLQSLLRQWKGGLSCRSTIAMLKESFSNRFYGTDVAYIEYCGSAIRLGRARCYSQSRDVATSFDVLERCAYWPLLPQLPN